jgi:hypothetical protein
MSLPKNKAVIVSCVILAVAIVVAATIVFLPKRPVPPTAPSPQATAPSQQAGNNHLAANTTSTVHVGLAPIPQGSQTYQIMQAESAMPKIVQATVNPVNVRVGDMQTLTVVISDPDPITSVVAMIETDNGTTKVPLTLTGAAALNDVVPQKYSVNAQSQLVLTNPTKDDAKGNVAFAAEGDETYTATWTVKDTHTARYSTVFTATDANGNLNSVKIGWTDAVCSWNGINNNSGATSSISSVFGSGGCAFLPGVTDGVENGNLLIDAPVTLAQGSSLVVNPGHSISFSGSGYLLIPATTPLGQIEFSDMYCAASGWVTAFSSPADGTYQVARSQISSNVFPGQTAYFTTPTVTNYGTNTWNYNCNGTLSAQQNLGPTTAYINPFFEVEGWDYWDQNGDEEFFSDDPDCEASYAQDWGVPEGEYCSNYGYLTGGYYASVWGNAPGLGTEATEDVRYCATSQSQTQCTPWLSQGGGWSDWTPQGGSDDDLNPAVSIQTTTLPVGMVFTGMTHGLQLDENNNMSDIGNSCSVYQEIGPVGTTTGVAYATTYCNGTSLSTTPDQMRVYLNATETSISSSPASICPSIGGCN